MDSGNSGSVSSSDEEYDADPSSFLNHFGSISHPQQPSSSMFDLSSSYLHHALDLSHGSFLNLDSQGQRPASSATNQCLLGHHDNVNNMNAARQQSKKRSRALRRAPTTVLTTDTSNFRSMVQEFTGIPASPPFSRRLPLLSTSRSTLLPYQLPPQNLMHHSIPSIFQPSSLVPAAAGFGPTVLDHAHHDLVGAQGLRSVVDDDGGGRRDPFIRCLDGNNNYGGCKLNMSVSASTSLNHEKNLENVGNSPREGAVEPWINSSSPQ